ncbi:MAG: hypothetical protein QOH05_1071 [Acetobacteraceae bacterium]|jgi:hypothetical protein|nr:hypothetical protein [Acetobacteraceae bacterium]
MPGHHSWLKSRWQSCRKATPYPGHLNAIDVDLRLGCAVDTWMGPLGMYWGALMYPVTDAIAQRTTGTTIMTFSDGLVRLSSRFVTFGENHLRFCWTAGFSGA